MKTKLFRLLMYLVLVGGFLATNFAKAQTAGTLTVTVNPTAHSGTSYSNNHFIVIWNQNASGTFVKTKLRLGASGDVNQHCQYWVANTTAYGGASNVLDATTGATITSYGTPITSTWNATDIVGTTPTNGTTPFNLVPDGTYRVYMEGAWDASYVLGVGRDTTSITWTKGPNPQTLTLPDVTNFQGLTLTWNPAAPRTITTSAIAPTLYAAGAAVSVPFTISADTIYNNNIWTAQLSDASGSFANPVSIGTLAGKVAATVAATIPAGTPNGTGYRIRIVGSQPATIGTDNGANITVTNGISPTLVAAIGATVDNPFIVTFVDDPTWRAAVTGIKIGGTSITAGYVISAGQITFTPSASVPLNLLQVAGIKNISVAATAYGNALVAQPLGVGVDTKLAIKTQPTSPITSGAVLATQPAIYIQDQYSNITTSTATITAIVGSGVWTIGGTTAIAAAAGTTSFTDLTATSATNVTATITFTSPGVTPVTSNLFTVNVPLAGGTVTVGPAGDYTSFTKAGGLFAALNGSGLSGSMTANVIGDILDEDGTNALNQWNEFNGSGYTLTIQPSGSTARTLSGTLAGPLFNFNGADRVTINGLNTGGNALTISNLSNAVTAGTATIKLAGDATNNTITNCTVLGSGLTTGSTTPVDGGTIYIGMGVTTGNDNITISNCKVGPAGANLPSKGIYSNGSTASSAIANGNVSITNCEIYDFFATTGCAGIYANTGNTDWSITNNKIYQIRL